MIISHFFKTQDILNKRKALETNIVQLERDLKSETDAKNSAQQKLTEIENKIQLEKQAVAEAKKSYEAAKSQRIEMVRLEPCTVLTRTRKKEPSQNVCLKTSSSLASRLKQNSSLIQIKECWNKNKNSKMYIIFCCHGNVQYEAKLAKKVKREEQRKSTKIKAGIGGSFDLGSKSFTMQTVPGFFLCFFFSYILRRKSLCFRTQKIR